mmetsp:Transcript_26908/g.79527  ORF Transcript_26908/g.79527 Transcript_26908/m.79527 type:complete len:145 (+) Transcript_26908:159-593(+)
MNGLSATRKRVIFLVQKLSNDWTHVFMDNLFNSVSLARVCYQENGLVHGVMRTNDRGFPPDVIQSDTKTKAKQAADCGTVKVAVLRDPHCPDLVACSVYDTKPLHLLLMVTEPVKWTVKTRNVWDGSIKKVQPIQFLRINMIDR